MSIKYLDGCATLCNAIGKSSYLQHNAIKPSHLFLTLRLVSPGEPEVTGMGSVDGNGVLEMGVSGTATWLIIPYSEAAPTHDVKYDIGGTLYYTVGGQNITVPLFPETITVTPDPRLYLNYFLERNVRSDDPLTEGTVVCSTRQFRTAAFVFHPTDVFGHYSSLRSIARAYCVWNSV